MAIFRRAHSLTNPSSLLHCRLCSTFNTSGDAPNSKHPFPNSLHGDAIKKPSSSNSKYNDQIGEKWKEQLFLGLMRLEYRYAIHGQLASETIETRQAFLNNAISRLSVLSALPSALRSHPTLLPGPQGPSPTYLYEKLKNLNRLDRLISLKETLLKEDEMSAELMNSRQASLREIIHKFSSSFSGICPEATAPPLTRKKRNELNKELMRLREIRSNPNPTSLSQTLKVLCEKLKTFNNLMRLKGMETKPRLTLVEVDVILSNFTESFEPPPLDHKSWQKEWNELIKRWIEFRGRLLRLRSREMKMAPKPNSAPLWRALQALSARMGTLDRLMRLKERLMMEDDWSMKLTNSRLICLDEFNINFSVPAPLIDEGKRMKWNELNEGLMRLREMEVEDAELLAARTNSELPQHQELTSPAMRYDPKLYLSK